MLHALRRTLLRAGGDGDAQAALIASLFGASEPGLMTPRFSNFSKLWQDSARTTPVTAVGDPVGAIDDISGRGVFLIQATGPSRMNLRQDGSGFYYLEGDGSDNSYVTSATIDFSATDKMSVWTGVHKASDAAAGLVVGLTSTLANPGSFEIQAPTTAAGNYGFYQNGTAIAGRTATTYTAPITNVISCAFDIAGATISPRINGLVPTMGANATAGTGNFSNAAVYVGRRGGSTLPLNGRIYGLIIRGAASSAAQIQAGEAYIASLCGVTL